MKMGVSNYISNCGLTPNQKKTIASGPSDKFKYPHDFNHEGFVDDSKKSHKFFMEFRELFYALAIVGRFPFQRDENGLVNHSLFSLSALYWIILYGSLMFIASDILTEAFFNVFGDCRFDAALGHARNSIVLINLILLPLCSLWEWRKMANYINEWDQFLITFKYMTGKEPEFRLKPAVYVLVISTPLLILGATFLEQDTLGIKGFQHRLLYIMLFSGMSYFSQLWALTQAVVQNIADYLEQELKKFGKMSRTSSKISAIEVHRLRCIWAKGSSLLHKSGECLGLSMMVIFLTNAACFVIASYGLLTAVFENDFRGIAHHCFNVFAGITFMICGCESGFRSAKKMGDNMIASLSAVDVSSISEVTSREVNVFLQILSLNPAVVMCAGVITIDRSFLTSVFSNTITYLIVLLQFKTTDLEFARNNETLTSVLQKSED